MDELSKKSFKQSGSQNVYQHKGNWYMWEPSRREYPDGSITGRIAKFECDPKAKESVSAKIVGSFRIDGRTGDIRGTGLKKLMKVM
jgi:hypothetical protein